MNETDSPVEEPTKSSILHSLLVTDGPLNARDLCDLCGKIKGLHVPTKNVPAMLKTLIRNGVLTVRPLQRVNYYMTINQAEDWDEKRADVIGQNGNDGEHYAHVMSTPPVTDESDVAEEDMPPAADPELLALANKMMSKRIDDLEADIRNQRALNDAKVDLIADLENQLAEEGAALNRLIETGHSTSTGRLAMIYYGDGDADIDYLEPYVTEAEAVDIAINQTNVGDYDRVALIRVLGEAQRPPAIFAPLVAPEIATLRGAKAAA